MVAHLCRLARRRGVL